MKDLNRLHNQFAVFDSNHVGKVLLPFCLQWQRFSKIKRKNGPGQNVIIHGKTLEKLMSTTDLSALFMRVTIFF